VPIPDEFREKIARFLEAQPPAGRTPPAGSS